MPVPPVPFPPVPLEVPPEPASDEQPRTNTPTASTIAKDTVRFITFLLRLGVSIFYMSTSRGAMSIERVTETALSSILLRDSRKKCGLSTRRAVTRSPQKVVDLAGVNDEKNDQK